jgi:hypothetical protein
MVAMALLTGLTFAVNKPTLATPTLSCAGGTQTSINITFTAGSAGAPAGFSIQWITADALAANNGVWPSDESQYCKASFSGNASGYNYSLAAGASKTVTLGDTLFDTPGASSACDGVALTCGTTYVFRAFAHANSTYNRSAFSANTTCSTAPCGNSGGCTLTQGYWKNHTPLVCEYDPTSPLCIQWPVSQLTLGTNSYSVVDLVDILNTPAQGNGLIALAHQLIAAKLNIANGASSTPAVDTAISQADTMIGNLVVPPLGADTLPTSTTSSLVATLTSYNEGAIGPGHCN